MHPGLVGKAAKVGRNNTVINCLQQYHGISVGNAASRPVLCAQCHVYSRAFYLFYLLIMRQGRGSEATEAVFCKGKKASS